MTPQEKAQELIEKYLPTVRGADRYNYNVESMNVFIAKECAKIAVDEILETLKTCWDEQGAYLQHNYWENVKLELEQTK